jgi:hypothetical protein
MLRLASALPKCPLASSSSARNFSSSPSLNFAPSSSLNRQRVIILGSGWSGYELLNKIDRERYDVITGSHSPSSFPLFRPADPNPTYSEPQLLLRLHPSPCKRRRRYHRLQLCPRAGQESEIRSGGSSFSFSFSSMHAHLGRGLAEVHASEGECD